jgi:hypothetical protein
MKIATHPPIPEVPAFQLHSQRPISLLTQIKEMAHAPAHAKFTPAFIPSGIDSHDAFS